MWFKELAGIGDTKENLAAAAEGENYEWTDMYEGFAKTAEERLRNIMKKDIVHFLRILKLHRYLKRAKSKYGNAVIVDIS